MSKASEVANELRKLADALDKEPDAVIVKPVVSFSTYSKPDFLAAVKIIPRPVGKRIRFEDTSYEDLCVEYCSDAIKISADVARKLMCTLVEPAKPAVYACPPILSLEEEEALA